MVAWRVGVVVVVVGFIRVKWFSFFHISVFYTAGVREGGATMTVYREGFEK